MIEPAGKDQIFIRKLSEIILTNLGNENFGANELVHESGMSQYTLNQRLSSITGKTINQFIRETRLHKALEMLQNEEVTASEVAYKVGFSSPTYFNTCFSDFFGFPPGTIKKAGSGNTQEINSVQVKAKQIQKRGIRKTFIIISSGILSVVVIAYLFFNVFIKNSTSDTPTSKKNSGKSSGSKIDNNNTVKDIDGNIYHTVTIGTQVWMVEDLRTTHYNDGTPIPHITDTKEWENLKSGAYCWNCWLNNAESDKTVYGALYNWYATTDKLCPVGWHVSTDEDWEILIDYCGGWEIAGGKLKEAGTAHWESPNIGATNEFGFTAIPFGGQGKDLGYWCPPRFGYVRSLSSDRTWIYLTECHECDANYVRCVRD
jgi:uncharacterized protein (TIGR02145 family)